MHPCRLLLVNYLPHALDVQQYPGGSSVSVPASDKYILDLEKDSTSLDIYFEGTLISRTKLPGIEEIAPGNSMFKVLHLFKPLKINFRNDDNQGFNYAIYDIPKVRIHNLFLAPLRIGNNIKIAPGCYYDYSGPRLNGFPLGTSFLTSMGQYINTDRPITNINLGSCIFSPIRHAPAEYIVTTMYNDY